MESLWIFLRFPLRGDDSWCVAYFLWILAFTGITVEVPIDFHWTPAFTGTTVEAPVYFHWTPTLAEMTTQDGSFAFSKSAFL
jgi:hypothetical protein